MHLPTCYDDLLDEPNTAYMNQTVRKTYDSMSCSGPFLHPVPCELVLLWSSASVSWSIFPHGLPSSLRSRPFPPYDEASSCFVVLDMVGQGETIVLGACMFASASALPHPRLHYSKARRESTVLKCSFKPGLAARLNLSRHMKKGSKWIQKLKTSTRRQVPRSIAAVIHAGSALFDIILENSVEKPGALHCMLAPGMLL